jgi:hypothetical protein
LIQGNPASGFRISAGDPFDHFAGMPLAHGGQPTRIKQAVAQLPEKFHSLLNAVLLDRRQ